MNQTYAVYEILVRLAAMLLACIALGACAPSLVTVLRADPHEPGRYTRPSEPRMADGVAVFRHGQSIAAGLPVALQPADVLETGTDALAVIRYPDGGEVVLDSSTRVHVGSLFVEFGRILARVRGLFAVDTESVITGVEGTEYTLEVKRGGAVVVIVLDGVVLCRSRSGSWDPVRLRRGDAFLSDFPNRTRPEVRPASANELEDIRGLRCTAAGRGPQCTQEGTQEGYCCDDGRVFGSARESCRGFFASSQKEAERRCKDPAQSAILL